MEKPIRVGIVGGGQLGKMMAIAAKQLGMMVTIIDPTPQSPAGQVSDKQIIGGYKDEKTTLQLGKEADVITIDAEFVNDAALEKLVKKRVPVHPSPKTIQIIKDKFLQKEFLKKHNISTGQFVKVTTRSDVEEAGRRFGYPFLLKAREDAYDGKGNFVVKTKLDITKGLEMLNGRSLYVEKFVPFIKELAIMVARNTKGEIKTYPVVETIQKNNVCDTVIAPAKISKKAQRNATSLAKIVLQKLGGAGVFGIEMFLLKNNTVLVNEIAPRVHNSGHYTIEACVTSQFQQHIRAITGMPLGETGLVCKTAVMKNILGKKIGSGFPKGLQKALAISHVSIHMYGKHESKIGRKMGHITVIGNSISECLQKANKARAMLEI